MIDFENITPDNLPLDFVKSYLRIDHDFDDVELQLMIKAAKSYIRNNLRVEKDEELDTELVIPMLTLVAHFYENKTTLMKSTEKIDIMFNSILSLHRKEIL